MSLYESLQEFKSDCFFKITHPMIVIQLPHIYSSHGSSHSQNFIDNSTKILKTN